MTPLLIELNIAATIVAITGLIAAVASIRSSRDAKKARDTLTTNNGGSTAKDQADRQEALLNSVADAVRSVGHQLGEVRADVSGLRRDLGRVDERVSQDIRELRRFHQE